MKTKKEKARGLTQGNPYTQNSVVGHLSEALIALNLVTVFYV